MKKMLLSVREKAHKAHHALHVGESWTHALYCGVLFVEGHGLYATVGGALGFVVLLNLLLGVSND